MELNSACRKSEQAGPVVLSISFEMLSKPVALPMVKDFRPSFICVAVMGDSLSREVCADVGGFSWNYWEQENCGSAWSSLSLYRFLKNVVSSSICTCWSGSSHLALDLRSLIMAHHSWGDFVSEDCSFPWSICLYRLALLWRRRLYMVDFARICWPM